MRIFRYLYCHIPVLSCILLLAGAGTAHAVAVTASVNVNGATSFDDGPTYAERRLEGPFGGIEDIGVDRAVAESDLAAGTLRVAAREGGRVSTGPRMALASATQQARLTFGAPAGAGREVITITFAVDAEVDANAAFTGDQVGGITATTFFARLDIDGVLQTPTGITRRLGGLAQVSHTTRYEFIALTPSIVAQAIPSGPFVTPAQFVDASQFGLGNPIQDARVVLNAASINGLNALLQIDVLVGNGDVFDLHAQMSARSSGAVGHFAGIDALNTGRFAIEMPDGFSFTSQSGVFLSNATAAIPAPASLLIMLSGLCGFAALRQAGPRRRDGPARQAGQRPRNRSGF